MLLLLLLRQGIPRAQFGTVIEKWRGFDQWAAIQKTISSGRRLTTFPRLIQVQNDKLEFS
jgi:hypothetical protein